MSSNESELTPASPSLPGNVQMAASAPLEGILEGLYWERAMIALMNEMGSDFQRYRFLFHLLKTGDQPDLARHATPDTVLIVLADNTGTHFQQHFAGFKAVFKVHLSGSSGNVHPVPLGYTRLHLADCETPVLERERNVFYSGNLNANRVDLYRALFTGGLPPKANFINRQVRRAMLYTIRKFKLRREFHEVFPSSHIRFTEAFGQGLAPADYTAMLETSKISISPRGFWRPECFRDHESMRSGCIVISDPLFKTWYFEGGPIIQLERWSDLHQTVRKLLASPDEMEERQNATIAWWKDKCSPPAVARHIASVLS